MSMSKCDDFCVYMYFPTNECELKDLALDKLSEGMKRRMTLQEFTKRNIKVKNVLNENNECPYFSKRKGYD